MMNDNEIAHEQAMILIDRAQRHQMRGELAEAIVLYKRSLTIRPTAEAHTFLGWAYSMLDRYDEAIEACEQAIMIDPTFGNPYNDIGSYLIDLERYEEAIEWLEKAIDAPRYDVPQFPHFNLGRVYEKLGRYQDALASYRRALEIQPTFMLAEWARTALLGQLN